jgi:hypothetical protein
MSPPQLCFAADVCLTKSINHMQNITRMQQQADPTCRNKPFTSSTQLTVVQNHFA